MRQRYGDVKMDCYNSPCFLVRTHSHAPMNQAMKSEIRDRVQIDWVVPIRMTDGLLRRAAVIRPITGSDFRHHQHLAFQRRATTVFIVASDSAKIADTHAKQCHNGGNSL